MIALAFLAALACDGVTDDTQAMANALQMAEQGRDKTVELPSGTCVFASQPPPITRGVSVRGQGKSWTVLQCNGSGLSCVRLREQGTNLRDLSVWTGPGTWGNIGIAIQCNNSAACGNHVLEHVWVSSPGALWASALVIDGSSRTASPAGARTVVMNDVSLFNSASWNAVITGCHSCEWRGGGIYPGGGANLGAYITGGTTRFRLDADTQAPNLIDAGTLR